jgi:hypothetical protein
MPNELAHYHEVAEGTVDPVKREAVAIVAPLLADDLGLKGLGLAGGLTVKWYRPTTRTHYLLRSPGDPPLEAFVAQKGLDGLVRGGDRDGVLWLNADVPLHAEQGGLLWTLAHEAQHVQSFLRPHKAYEAIGEVSCEFYAGRFLKRLRGEAPTRPRSRPAPRTQTTGWGPGSPTWRLPWQYSEPSAGRVR